MAAQLDLRGQPFGKWLVLYKGPETAHGQFWVCQCVCNPAVTVELVEAALVEEWTRSCGCDYVNTRGAPRPRVNFVGRQIGKRLVLEFVPQCRRGHPQYRCRCVCGILSEVKSTNLVTRGQCLSCAMQKPLMSRWYGEVFVEATVGVATDRHVTYLTRFPDGSVHIVRGAHITNGKTTGVSRHRNHGVVAAQRDMVFAWVSQGLSQRAIAKRLGVSKTSVQVMLRRHPEYHALIASLPPDEMLVGDAS